jgi:hypothetical protein
MREFATFLRSIELARETLGLESDEECFFRGHADGTWPLLPSLLRHCAAHGIRRDLRIRELEAGLFFEFQARARELHGQTLTDWEILFYMRHHGVATRLLDWTEVFAVALYFAVQSVPDGAVPCIWMLNPYTLNEHAKSWETRDLIAPQYLGGSDGWDYSDFMTDYEDLSFGWRHPVALYPIQRSARLFAQGGYFTIHGDNRRPIEQIRRSVLRKVDLPRGLIPQAKRFLALTGINDYLLFPDLDGLARYLHRKHSI